MLAFTTKAIGQKQIKDFPLFTINEKSVGVNEFVFLYNKNHQNQSEEITKENIEEYLELYINFKLKVMEAESRKMDASDAFIKELNTYKEELRKPFIAEADILDKLVEEAYDRLGWEIKASHILVSSPPDAAPSDTLVAYNKALSIREKVLAGEQFDKLARELSEDPSAKSNGGLLGYFSALQMVYPFEEAAFQLNVGDVSQPVRTRFGYHLIKVEDKRPSSGEVEVSHILVRGSDEQAKNRISEVYEKLIKGSDWNEMCAMYSQDPGTKDNGGRLRPFAPGALASAPKFEEVAFAMDEQGSISEPFQTSFGWHIIRFEKKIALPAFSELEESLKRRVARDERMSISKTLLIEKRKKKLNYKEDPSRLDRIKAMTDSVLISGKWSLAEGLEKENRLFSLNGKFYSVGDFSDFILRNQSPTNISPGNYINQLYELFVEETLAATEDEKLQNENPEYRSLVKEYREGILLFSIMEKEVWNKASEDSIGQRRYYDLNTGKYEAGMRLEARIFATANRDLLKAMKSRIISGDTLKAEDMKQFKSVTPFRAFEKGEHEAINNINWTVGLHEAEANGMYYLVEAIKLMPPGIKKFEEVRANVISDYQDKLERDWIAQLKGKYRVKVNAKGKKKAIVELTSKDKL